MTGAHRDLADAIVAFADAMGLPVDEALFSSMTEHCGVADRDAVAWHLPAWAQRNLGMWEQAA